MSRRELIQERREIIARLQELQTQQSTLLLRLAELATADAIQPPAALPASVIANLPVAITQARAYAIAPATAPAAPVVRRGYGYLGTDILPVRGRVRERAFRIKPRLEVGHRVAITNPGPSQPTRGVITKINGERCTVRARDGTTIIRIKKNLLYRPATPSSNDESEDSEESYPSDDWPSSYS